MFIEILLFTGLLSSLLMYIQLKDRQDRLDEHLKHFEKRMLEHGATLVRTTEDATCSLWTECSRLDGKINDQEEVQDLGVELFGIHADRIIQNDKRIKILETKITPIKTSKQGKNKEHKPKAKKKTKKST